LSTTPFNEGLEAAEALDIPTAALPTNTATRPVPIDLAKRLLEYMTSPIIFCDFSDYSIFVTFPSNSERKNVMARTDLKHGAGGAG
jgi:hypothetical protein